MFKRVNVEIYQDDRLIYNSEGKTILGVAIQLAAILAVYRYVTLKVTLK